MSDIIKEKIAELELELKNTKVNKKTEMSVGQLKGKIAKFKEQLEIELAKGKGGGDGYAIKKEGDSTIGFLGKPSVGKSTLLSNLTNKESKIGAYEFTTLDVTPGLLYHNFTNLQVLDLPGIVERAADNRGFGKKVLSVVRVCDLVVFVVDCVDYKKEMKMLITETENSKIKVNKISPNIVLIKKHNGRINIGVNFSRNKIPDKLVKQILMDNRIMNCDIQINEKNLEVEDLLESIYRNIAYVRGVICINKIDKLPKEKLQQNLENIKKDFPNWEIFQISAEKKLFLEEFKNFLWENLDFIFVYLKEPKKKVDFSKPLVVKKNSKIIDVLKVIHNDFYEKFKFCNIKGKSVKFEWQQCGLEHKIKNLDIIEIVLVK